MLKVLVPRQTLRDLMTEKVIPAVQAAMNDIKTSTILYMEMATMHFKGSFPEDTDIELHTVGLTSSERSAKSTIFRI